MHKAFSSNQPYEGEIMSNGSSAPVVQVEDNEEGAVEFGPEAIKSLVAEAIRENPIIDLDELRQLIAEECAKIYIDPGLMQEAVMKQLSMMLHGQAKNFAEHTAHNIEETLRAEYAAYQESQKWSTTKKVFLVGGTAVGLGTMYYLGRRNGRKIGDLENG